jgi:hypothetical protein
MERFRQSIDWIDKDQASNEEQFEFLTQNWVDRTRLPKEYNRAFSSKGRARLDAIKSQAPAERWPVEGVRARSSSGAERHQSSGEENDPASATGFCPQDASSFLI